MQVKTDNHALLGKRLRLTLDFPNAKNVIVTGVCVGYIVTVPDFRRFQNEILFLEDGYDEPDFICFDFDRMEVIS